MPVVLLEAGRVYRFSDGEAGYPSVSQFLAHTTSLMMSSA